MMETVRRKKQQNTTQLTDVVKHNQCDRCTEVMIFTPIIHS